MLCAHAFTVYKWAQAGTFYEDIAIPKFTYGLMALCAMDLFFLGSLAIVRQKCYSLFLFSHIVGFACLSVAVRSLLQSRFAIC